MHRHGVSEDCLPVAGVLREKTDKTNAIVDNVLWSENSMAPALSAPI